MKIEVNQDDSFQLEQVYLPITLVTDDKETIGICMRDTGFEFNYNGVWYEAKQGIVREMKKEEPKQEDCSCTDECLGYLTKSCKRIEEPKQETQGYICPHTKKQCDDECCVSAKDCHLEASMGVLSEPKQETLEEFAKQEAIKQYSEDTFGNLIVRKSIEKGAKWQSEQENTANDILNYILTNDDGVGIALGYNSREMIEQHFKNIGYER